MNQELNQRKADLRQELKARRAQLPDTSREQENQAILAALLELAPLQRAECVFCFISHGDEVATHALIDDLLHRGKRVIVPRILPDRGMIAVPFGDWSELKPGQLGILTPASTDEYSGAVDVCITPGLGFTETGERLGYGRGYYDRWFSAHHVAHRIAIGYDCQVVDELPVDENDVPVTMLITGRRRKQCQS